MKLTLEDWLKLADDSKTAIVTLDGVEVPLDTIVAADDEAGTVTCMSEDTIHRWERAKGDVTVFRSHPLRTFERHGAVKIRVIEVLGASVAEHVTARERL